MNLSLLDPNVWVNAYPEIIEDCLELGGTVTGTAIKFNARGSLLAVGCYDGRVLIYDFETRSVVRELTTKSGEGHVGLVSSLSWTRNGAKLLTGAYDRKALIWDVLSGKVEKCFMFQNPIIKVQFHPRNKNICLVCPLYESPVLIDLTTDKKTELPVTPKTIKNKKQDDCLVASFNRIGDRIYVGNSFGYCTILQTQPLKVIHQFQASATRGGGRYANAINAFVFSKKGKYYLINCGEKLRLFDVETNSQVRVFQDVVNQTKYSYSCFSGKTILTDKDWDSDYIIASSNCQIFIWDRITGDLVKILEGPKDNILCLEWHPFRPILVSSTKGGVIYIWSKNYTESWSAFAPDFQEIEQNEYYVEREDEFDIIDDDQQLKKEMEDVDIDVDITTVDPGPLDSDVSENEIIIPTYPIKDSEMEKLQQLPSPQVVKKPKVKKTVKKTKKKAKKRKLIHDSDDEFIISDDDSDYEAWSNQNKKKPSKTKKIKRENKSDTKTEVKTPQFQKTIPFAVNDEKVKVEKSLQNIDKPFKKQKRGRVILDTVKTDPNSHDEHKEPNKMGVSFLINKSV